jgi:phospholipid/cholesterol/gamma-HCH transport system permease protein
MGELAAVPRGWIEAFGEIVKFSAKIVGEIARLRVLRYFGETLRQAGILILSSTLVIWGLVFIIGLQCGIEGAYFNESTGTPAYSGVFAAWCDLRELVPLISGITFLCATRLLAALLVLPFVYLCSIGAGFLASYIAVVQQIGYVSSGGFFLIFWEFQNPPDLLFSLIKAMGMAVLIILVGCYYGYNASGGPVGVGTATAKSMVVNIVGVHLISMLGTQLFWGANPRAPIGG